MAKKKSLVGWINSQDWATIGYVDNSFFSGSMYFIPNIIKPKPKFLIGKAKKVRITIEEV